MIRLVIPTESYWLENFSEGVRVKVRPLDTPLYETAQAKARRMVGEILDGNESIDAAGGRIVDLPDLSDPDAAEGTSQFLFAMALAQAGIVEWSGIGDENGNPAPVSELAISQFMRIHNMAEQFLVKYTKIHDAVLSEGKLSGASQNGISAVAPDTAKAAKKKTSPAPKAAKGQTAKNAHP